jgi:hypothetical protein
VLRASAAAQQTGIPTVSILSTGFLKQAVTVSKGLGVNLAWAEYPGHPLVDSVTDLRAKVEKFLMPAIISALTAPKEAFVPAALTNAEPEPGSVVFSGTLAQVQEQFHRKLWSDGLPVIPPTREAVEEFLAFSPRHRDDILGVLAQEAREASVLSVAVNGVMAGCRPEYMPLLLAIVEVISVPEFRVEDAGSTPSWEPLIIVSGPIIKQLDLNFGQGVMKIGRQANTSIGRFLRLYLRNICGYRIPHGDGDKGSIGLSFNVALAEDEDTARQLGWSTFGTDRGYAADQNLVTVTSVVCISPPAYSSGSDAISLVRHIVEVLSIAFSTWAFTGLRKGIWHPLLILSPAVADVIAKEWGKDDIRQYFWQHATLSARLMEQYAMPASGMPLELERLVAEGILPPDYTESADPERQLRMLVKPEHLCIVVAGDPGRNQSRGYMPNHNQGFMTSRPIALPAQWERLLAQKGD